MSESEKHEPDEKQEGILDSLLTRIPSASEKANIRNLELGRKRWAPSAPEHLATDTPYSAEWNGAGEEVDNIFRETLNGKSLLDLGGASGTMKGILDRLGITLKKYTNVDKFHFKQYDTSYYNGKTKQEFNFSEQGDMINVSAGMLDFLQYVADSSVEAISLNGIDDKIIADDDYHDELVRQIRRVLKPSGIILGCNSEAIAPLTRDPDFETKWKKTPWFAILEKKEPKEE